MADPAPQTTLPKRALLAGLAVSLLLAVASLALWLMPPSSDRDATPAELLEAIAGFPEDPDVMPPFRAAAELDPQALLSLAQDPTQIDTLRHLFTAPHDVLEPEGERLSLVAPRGRCRDPRPLFEVALHGAPANAALQVHLLDLDREGVAQRYALPGESSASDRATRRSVRPATTGLMPGRYAWWVEPTDPLDAPQVGTGGTAVFTVLDRDTASLIESYLPAVDGQPVSRVRRAAVLLCAGLAQEALVELEAGGFPSDRPASEVGTSSGDVVEDAAILLAAAAWRRLGDLDAVARQIAALVNPR